MEKVLYMTTTVLPGGKIEIVDEVLIEGEFVEVLVCPSYSGVPHRYVVDIVHDGPKRTLFKTAAEVYAYFNGEWES